MMWTRYSMEFLGSLVLIEGGIVLPCESALFVPQLSCILLIAEASSKRSESGDILATAVFSLVGRGILTAVDILEIVLKPI